MTATVRDRGAGDRRFLTPLALGATLNPINSSLIATALVPIAAHLGVSPGRTAILVASLYVACAVAQPTLGRVGEVFGARRVFLAGTVVVALGALAGTFATTLWHLVAARVLIGIGTSAAYPSAVQMIRARELTHAGGGPRRALGVLTLAGQVTVAAGLPLGGVLVEFLGWRSVFAVNLPVAAVCFVMTLRWIPADPAGHRPRAAALKSLDLPGVALFAVTVTALLTALRSPAAVDGTAIGLCVLAGGALVWWELRARTPFLDVRALTCNRSLSVTYARTAGFYATTYTMMYAFTLWLQQAKGVSASLAGATVLPMTVVAAPIGWYVARRGAVRLPLLVAAVAVTVTSAGLLFVTAATPLAVIALVPFGFGFVLGTMSSGNQNALYSQAPTAEVGVSAGLFRTSVYLGAVASSALTGVVFGEGVDDHALSVIARCLIATGGLLFLLILGDRALPRHMRSFTKGESDT